MTCLAHALGYVLPVAFAIRAASWFGMLPLAHLVGFAMVATCWYADVVHRRTNRLCKRCVDEVPADAPVRAERRWLILKFAHFTGTVAGLIWTLGVCVPPLLAMIMLPRTEVPLLLVATDVWVFAMIYSHWVHDRLRPWCPHCRRWDDDGDHEPSPDPALYDARP